MSDAEKLEALVRKAVEGGWDSYGWPDWAVWGEDTIMFYDKSQEHDHTKMVQHGNELELSTIIFNHDFARALFGNDHVDCDCSHECECQCAICRNGWDVLPLGELHSWQHHLQQAVISPDPIDYMYKAVFGDV